MREVGRNDPCPCGSGRKHKRCCLDREQTALRIAREAQQRIRELGDWVREERPDAWRTAYERQLTPLNGFGGVPAENADWLDTWLVCDAPAVDGVSPLAAVSPPEPEPGRRLAARQRGRRLVAARHGASAAGDAMARGAVADLARRARAARGGRRGIAAGCAGTREVQPGHVAVVGRPVVVDDAAVDDVLAVLADDPAHALCAALRWPEVREHTAEGQLVQECYRRYRLLDPEAAVAAMRACANAIERDDLRGYWEDDTTFTVVGASGRAIAIEPAPEHGIVWELCDEDRADPPVLGEVTVSPDDAEFSLSAVTQERVERLMAALPPQIRSTLGELTADDLDRPDILPRVSRDRLRTLMPAR